MALCLNPLKRVMGILIARSAVPRRGQRRLNPLKRVMGILILSPWIYNGLGNESQSPKAGHGYSNSNVSKKENIMETSLNPLKRVMGILIPMPLLLMPLSRI